MLKLSINVNDPVWVRLTPEGMAQYTKHYRDLGIEPQVLQYSLAGFTEFQLWDLMHIFGPALFNGCRVPFETEVHFMKPE